MVRYYHIRPALQEPQHSFPITYYELDLSSESMEESKKQYQEREEVFFKGRWIEFDWIKEIEIRGSALSSREYQLGSSTIFYGNEPSIYDVTRQFVKPPTSKEKISVTFRRNVFIVHGHDIGPVRELVVMPKALGLNPPLE